MKRIIVVTGASSGMGREFALQICRRVQADELWALGRNQQRLEELQDQVDAKVVPIALDLTDRKEVKEKFVSRLEEENPRVLILGNCAGFGKFDHTENLDADTLVNMVDLNVSAYVAMISWCLPHMDRGGKIMNISSCAGFQPIPYINCYAATKAFVTSYGRALNEELKYRDIHVLTVTPFWTKTAFFDRAIDPKKKLVVLNYAAMYDPAKVMRQAVKDLFTKKEISCYGVVNQLQWVLVRLLPKKIVMKVWMKSQSLDGTPGMRP